MARSLRYPFVHSLLNLSCKSSYFLALVYKTSRHEPKQISISISNLHKNSSSSPLGQNTHRLSPPSSKVVQSARRRKQVRRTKPISRMNRSSRARRTSTITTMSRTHSHISLNFRLNIWKEVAFHPRIIRILAKSINVINFQWRDEPNGRQRSDLLCIKDASSDNSSHLQGVSSGKVKVLHAGYGKWD